ncbi:hypothetical protein ACPOLB_26105 [Rubrivivax sp. RP6-9]|uniref:hypothetical protein n=1 Tax=Rubrivivax sp. RP6-9 TaxID=3415750 RepID=UPI003CC67C88
MLLLCATGLPAAPVWADAAAIAACRTLADAAPRLACYDAIGRPPAAPAASKPAQAPAAKEAPAVPAAPVVAAPPPDAPADFGLERRSAAAADPEVRSQVRGRFEGWQQRTRIALANGQVWEVTDTSRAAYWLDSPAVRVRRNDFGGYSMEIDGVARVLRVKRVE